MSHYDTLRQLDTSDLTTRDVGAILGVSPNTAGGYMRKLGKTYRKMPTSGGTPAFPTHGFPQPLPGDPEAHWRRLLRDRGFGGPRRWRWSGTRRREAQAERAEQ